MRPNRPNENYVTYNTTKFYNTVSGSPIYQIKCMVLSNVLKNTTLL